MPTTSARARRWIKAKKATYFYQKGVFCVRLNQDPSNTYTQEIACGVDPGGTWEAMTLKSKSQTLLNVQSDAVFWVKDALETRRQMRRGRRFRNTPCRQPRWNRSCLRKPRIPPSTYARWNAKLRLIKIWRRIIPISHYIIEDIAAVSKKGQRRWNRSFSPLEVGKNWFYLELGKLGKLSLKKGYETKALRDALSLIKSKSNPQAFEAHCVDSWVLANSKVGGHIIPDNTRIHFMTPLRFKRRMLHKLQPSKGDVRRREGGTYSLNFKRGSLVQHPKYNLCYLGGSRKGRLSLHSLKTGQRLTQDAKLEDCQIRGYNGWRWH